MTRNWSVMLLVLACASRAPAADYKEQAALFGQKCAKCHTIGKGDRVGPDLKGVTKRRERAWLMGFVATPGQYLDSDPIARELLDKYGGVRMDDTGLSSGQVEKLLAYIETMSESAVGGRPPPVAPAPRGLSGVGVAGPHEGFALWRLPGNDQGYAPAQPILYSHKLHAGKLEIACLYCHHNAEKGPVAGVPSLEICMNCHNRVKNAAGTDKPSAEIAKLAQAWADREKPGAKPVAWTRVHRLPAFVTFDHRAHVKNGLACQECHGPVQTMDVVRQASSLSMGFCVNCHRREGPDVPASWKRAPASQDCNACHQ